MSEPISFANPEVLEFYKELPFNFRESADESANVIRRTDYLSAYPVLRPLVRRGMRVLDVGCGTGWLTNSLAYHHRVVATGLDFNPIAVERAQAVAAILNLPTTFVVGDLFLYEPLEKFDLVVSIGVLHHTNDCIAAVRRLCERFVSPGGHVLIGLYHKYGRKPLLDHFQAMKDRGATEAEMLERYRELHGQLKDETLLLSWFRDQVLHPHETQHTLAEMVPVLNDAGLELVSTSINRFKSIESLPSLLEEERAFHEVGQRRLQENQYFTGFFVFLARKGGILEGSGQSLDTKPYVEHHPVFGYRYIPGLNRELRGPGGGQYRIQINSQGIRSDREYSFKKPKGVRRIIVCGDSMAAGQYISNTHRFSELLERRIQGLEVINLALEGSGTDQQVLLYENVGLNYEHDFVLLMPFVQNIYRNMVEAREGIDPTTGLPVLRSKPRFELAKGELVLRNVPVPREVSAATILQSGGTDSIHTWTQRMKTRLSAMPGSAILKKVLYGMLPWEPFPEYRNPRSREWVLMAAIILRLKALAGDRPLVIAPTFYANYTRFRMARNYWARYSSLANNTDIYVVDLLPYFKRLGPDALSCFQEPYDMHFSIYGNLVLADALENELSRLGLLSSVT